ncbi:prolyl-tRNA synthetase associated domain-containing protein [Clostridium tagluense]|uniref:prolyl-tRNA synthetase associated domain-containing protein n=1 Tax=Clostridium tagluense TaxID=360422 RepID=UPI001C6E9EC0|nr:prolyl-tRNA synthetase associated domain-containing protein [Clostridium tagluense]MBW9156014.1 prolyl-tRNA synthetase associated domain-containing protein [Clostridium tagluense]WLC64061.1 prolyl-tRNA synthetase associated domain-containing protein [Clostridium tagluense]
MSDNENKVYEVLKELNIDFEKREHPAVFTCEEAEEFTGDMRGVHTKNLFLRNYKGNSHYLVVTKDSKTLNIKEFEKKIGEKNMSFASKERLMKYLGLTPGGVSIFGLINDEANSVKLILDRSILENEYINSHPNVNTATVNLSVNDLKKFIKWSGNEVDFLDI